MNAIPSDPQVGKLAATPLRRSTTEPVWLEWLTLAGLLLFAVWLLGVEGVWALLFRADPTGITLIIIVVFTGGTFWCGQRSRELARQRRAIDLALADDWRQADPNSWAIEYWHGLARAPADSGAPADILYERAHGPHTTAWWVNGIQLKLGLLGKVIGFSILALSIGEIQSFDPTESQELLKDLTAGLGVALLTTMVGLVGNILLGLQLTRLDRFADDISTRAQIFGTQLSATSLSDSPDAALAVVVQDNPQ
ncbi:MAG: hypothetical protein WBD34_24175 [Burkholderiaceae bacterium]